ncbi:MAG: hypothetical protein ACLFQ6_09355 [Candidatus Sumerlaeia bacterium]
MKSVSIKSILGLVISLCLLTGISLGQEAEGEVKVKTGELIIEPPTLICLGFEWRVEGDSNGNAQAKVQYRKKGDTAWKDHLPLYRIGLGKTANYGFGNFGDPNHDIRYTLPDALCGSILDLEPGTEYEVRLEAMDPDGVEGEKVKMLTLSTRPEPKPFEGGEVRHVYPPGYKGEKEEPAYRSIMHAVNGFHPWCDCYQMVHPNAAKPGTIIKVHAGTYKIDYHNYRESTQRWLHGTITLIPDGTPDKPIAIVAAGDGEVIIDGNGCHNLFNVMAADYLYFEGLTIQNTEIAFHGGFQGVMGCKGLTVKNCWIENVTYGVLAQDGRSENFYVGDNVIIGKNPHDRFNPESGGAWGRTKGGYSVNLAGKGHVVCYNYTADMWDGLNVFTNSLADPALGQQSRAIDFYNNDVINSTDNFIETDGGYCNIRVLRNRCFNVMGGPLSTQPIYAGPVYFIRNIVWNAYKGRSPLKPGASTPILIWLNNTSSCNIRTPGNDQCDIRNNLFIGPNQTDAIGKQVHTVWYREGAAANRMIDYNAYRPGLPGKPYKVGNQEFENFDQMREATGIEKNAVMVKGYDVFEKAEEPNHAMSNKDRLVRTREVDLMPAAGAPIVDAGVMIPGVTDGYFGAAPDMGALERGKDAPVFGPRGGYFMERLKALREGRYNTLNTQPEAQLDADAGDTREPEQISVPTAENASLGKPVSSVEDTDGDGLIEMIKVGNASFPVSKLVFGVAKANQNVPLADLANFDMKNGMPSHGSGTLMVDVVDFGGKREWQDTNGDAPDFFIFEAGGNDNVLVAPILADETFGKAVAVGKGAWGDTKIDTPIGAGNAVGVAIEVTELLDASGKPLPRDTKLRGIRIISQPTGMDLTCVCAVR